MFYRLLKPLLFASDPETVHYQTMQILAKLETNQNNPITKWLLQRLENNFLIKDHRLEQTLWGLKFPNPIGLAAGFDKDGVCPSIWSRLGLGFAELGTVTYHPQSGQPKPRLFRLPQDQAILNRMGFNNQGAQNLATRLSNQSLHPIPIGINLGKSKITPLEEARLDYLASFKLLQNYGDYFVINVSSPNTPGLRTLQNTQQLTEIVKTLQDENQARKPLLVKIAPDLEETAIAEIIEIAFQYQLSGIIATNTTINRSKLTTKYLTTGQPIEKELGGISGAPLKERSLSIIHFIYQHTQGKIPIIGVGGILTPQDAIDYFKAGARLVQVYTGLVYRGPGLIKEILVNLLKELEKNNFLRS